MDPHAAAVENSQEQSALNSKLHRRRFLQYSGGLASAALVTTLGCKKDDDDNNGGVNLGSGDVGVLNYAYALEQLEAAFYTQVIASQFSGITAEEKIFLTDIRDHEIAHREFFKTAITAAAPGMIIPGLEVDFSKIDFGSRASVLGTAKAFEDLGVSAYNGAGKLLTNPTYLLLAGKIVSVEARHAALIRDLLQNGDFAGPDVINAMGLDVSRNPKDVLAIAAAYLKTQINANNLPTS
ncbi:MAG: ferritin-like domain-containing protein [Chitinophagaceae bacterium]